MGYPTNDMVLGSKGQRLGLGLQIHTGIHYTGARVAGVSLHSDVLCLMITYGNMHLKKSVKRRPSSQLPGSPILHLASSEQ